MIILEFPARTDRRATLACLGIAAFAGLLWVVASPPIGWWPVGWIALTPTLWLVDRAPTTRRAALYAWISGSTASLVGFRWIATLLATQGGLPWPVGLLGVLILSAYHGLVMFFMARAIRALRHRKWPMAAAAPLALVAFEKLLPEVFPYFLAISQSPVPIAIQVADLAGPYAVTAMIAASAGAIYDGCMRRRRPGAITALALAAALGYGAIRMHQIDLARAAAPHAKVALISSGVAASTSDRGDRETLLDQLAKLQQSTAAAEAAGAELTVWSEAAYPILLPHELTHDLAERSPYRIRRGFTGPAIIGALTGGRTGAPWNSALSLGTDDRILARHDKVHRVLGSEYNPIVEWWPSAESWMPSGAGHLAAGDEAVALPVVIRGAAYQLGAMICFEDILPVSGRALAALHPNLLVNLTEDSWFGPDEPWQHLGLAVFRAVEVRADLVRAVNLGPSSMVDAAGRIVATGPMIGGAPQTLLVDVALVDGGGTVYAAIGDVFAWGCAIPTLGLWLWPWLRRRRWWRPLQHAPGSAPGGRGRRKRTR
ncbi:MAG: apolipoprotein N-acyltransferase [Deltaproteobacteria bacterium]|nr:apolipoprotein N-acyltransferase [Deltaproteobacteria bacterium]